ncbi:Carboxypeptidase regulatory-like domain-containing protein [Asanoa hainanensis]|uniref:Carboxypeptidase regulatory-like domain-containing protein n=1 Tax=Asanoa hainanensis TaxID=560556 RepID=A0A239MTH8_9ACTN|nr:carboxypeptidase-like regulatory domain-containing protein [Asanoa hainanensis]SNT46107.1 Carboxypeptidase regulatory-like domain-containing protein [Asanoa hainanensis]
MPNFRMRRITAALSVAVTAGALAVWATPAQAAGTGVLTGHVTTNAGAPAADVMVQVLHAEDYTYVNHVYTDADGAYRIAGLDTESYLIGFSGTDVAEQYYHGKTDIFDADPVQVTSGQTRTIDERLVATGFLVGRIVDASGTPYSGVVDARDAEGWSAGWGSADELGNYRIPVPVGAYRVSFEPVEGSYQRQYVPGKIVAESATLFEVAEGAEVRADDTVLGVGIISGQLRNTDGTPAVGFSVAAEPFHGNEGSSFETTDRDGWFGLSSQLAGSYQVRFWNESRSQYFDGAVEWDDADAVTVTAGQVTYINESLLPTGSVRVRAVDAITGIAVSEFCVDIAGCTYNGQLIVSDLYEGTHELEVNPVGTHLPRTGKVTVRADRTTDLIVRLLPAAKVTTTVLDRATGQPLAGVCLVAYQPARAYGLDGDSGWCSNAAGKVTIIGLEAGNYRLFARPQNKAYGRQWVGANGGTGDERAAATVVTKAGKTVTAPTVLVDRAGSISGTVTDAATGAPIEYAGVGTLTVNPGCGCGEEQTDAAGRYRIDGLGPYKWPLFYGRYAYASQWTGGAASRYASAGTQVTAGGTATVDVGLTRGVAVRGKLVVPQGSPTGWTRISVLNTETGDYAGTADFEGDTYELRMLPGQEILFRYGTEVDGDYLSSDRAALSPATPGGPVRYSVTVPTDGLTVDVLVDRP